LPDDQARHKPQRFCNTPVPRTFTLTPCALFFPPCQGLAAISGRIAKTLGLVTSLIIGQ